DFQSRDYMPHSNWPIRFEDLARYESRAAELLGCDDGSFTADAWPEAHDSGLDFTKLERWVNETNIVRALPDLENNSRVTVVLNATVIGFDLQPGARAINGVRLASQGREPKIFRGATYYVLAMGGVETARLLLNVQSEHSLLFGGTSGPLG